MITSNRSCRVTVSLLALIASISILSSVAFISRAQTTTKPQPKHASSSTTAARVNREVANIVREIDARNIERTIRKLVSFGTRNTLSAQNDPQRGIGAARDWLYSEFLKTAEASAGRMTVEKQTYEQAKAARVPQPTIVANIVATLKGT